jgi:hypothetical protein
MYDGGDILCIVVVVAANIFWLLVFSHLY